MSDAVLTGTPRRREALQWFALGAAPLAWAVELVLGFGVTQAACNAAGHRWTIRTDAWEISLMAAAASVVLVAEAAAIVLLRALREVGDSDPPPTGRQHFFATAAVVGNVLFLVIILLSGVGAVYLPYCQQS